MSALGQKQTFAPQKGMSALPPKADMCGAAGDVCFGPKADIGDDHKRSGSNAATRGASSSRFLTAPRLCRLLGCAWRGDEREQRERRMRSRSRR
jgi:hypothetical protein